MGSATGDPHRVTYRIRGIPASCGEEDFSCLLVKALALHDNSALRIRSFSSDVALPVDPETRTAVVSFSTKPGLLHTSCEVVEAENIKLICDTVFDGFTPLSPVESDEQTAIDCIVLPGWASHPIGSFMARDSPHVWLIDKVAKHFPQFRLWVYGFSRSIIEQSSGEDKYEFADAFVRMLRRMRADSKAAEHGLPIIYLAHSLGGLLFKEAMIRLKESCVELDQQNFMSTFGALLFGVPSAGMNVDALAILVGHLPSRTTLNDLDARIGTRLRKKQHQEFCKAFDFRDAILARFFELRETLTIQEDPTTKSGWSRCGPPELLVSETSATLGRPWETGEEFVIGLQGDHSTMVKLSEYSQSEYYKIYNVLEHFSKTAPTVISARRRGTDSMHLPALSESQTADSNKKRKRKERLLESLPFEGMDLRWLRIDRALEKTCQWIYGHPNYVKWIANTGVDAKRNFLWIKGKAGSGKSCLMKTLTQHVQEVYPKAICMSFFFDARGSKLDRSPRGLFRSLLSKLIQNFPSILEAFAAEYKVKLDTGHIDWKEEEMSEMLRQAMRSIRGQMIFLFIDALDECEDIGPGDHSRARNLLRFLEDILIIRQNSPQPAKICLSSRHYPHISCRDKTILVEICMQHENYKDICQYVRFWLQPNPPNDMPPGYDQIYDEIVGKSEGVFLWVVIVVQNLVAAMDCGKSKGYLLNLIQKTPVALQELYEQLMGNVDNDDRPELSKLIQWILFSEGPLTVEELHHALAFHQSSAPQSFHEWKESENYISLGDFKKAICDLSRGLIEVKVEVKDDEKHDRERFHSWSLVDDRRNAVQFIHETVRAFFAADGYRRSRDVDRLDVGSFAVFAENNLMMACFNYLSATDLPDSFGITIRDESAREPRYTSWTAKQTMTRFRRDRANQDFDVFNLTFKELWALLSEYPLVMYASKSFSGHANRGDLTTKQVNESGLSERLTKNHPTPLKKASKYQELFKYNYLLMYQELFKSLELFKDNDLSKVNDLFINDLFKDDDLFKYQELFKYPMPLFHLYEDCNRNSLLYYGFLQFFARRGAISIVAALLKSGMCAAEWSGKYPNELLPLEAAWKGGHIGVTRLLLDWGATKSLPSSEATFLYLRGIHEWSKDILCILLERGLAVDGKELPFLRTPLMGAAVRGDVDRATILLNYGADVNAQDADGRTALHWSSNSSVTRLLIERGANTDIERQEGHIVTWSEWETPLRIRRFVVEQKSLGPAEKQHAPWHPAELVRKLSIITETAEDL